MRVITRWTPGGMCRLIRVVADGVRPADRWRSSVSAAVSWSARAKAGREADLKAFITAAVTPSRNDPGNIDYEAHEVVGDAGAFVIYERWESREHLDAHLGAPRMTELVPRMLELIDGSIEDGISLLRPFRPEV